MTDELKGLGQITKVSLSRTRRVSRKWGSEEIVYGLDGSLASGADDLAFTKALAKKIADYMAPEIEEARAGLDAEGAATGEVMVAAPAPTGAPAAPVIVQPALPGTGVGPGTVERVITVDSGGIIKHAVTPNGNHYALVLNKPFVQHGVSAWPEPMDQFPGFEAWREWPIGTPKALTEFGVQRIVILTKVDGRTPDKILRFE